jgi:hypothetical protein
MEAIRARCFLSELTDPLKSHGVGCAPRVPGSVARNLTQVQRMKAEGVSELIWR